MYEANCPLYIYNESNGSYVCGMKHDDDDTFPNVEPIRLLYTPNTHDNAISPLSIFDTWRNLCRFSCCQDEPNFDTVFNDRNDSHSFFCTAEVTAHSVNLACTLSEVKLDFSLPDKSSKSTPITAIDCCPARPFIDLTLNDFFITDSEKVSIEKLQVLCERHDIQCILQSKNDNNSKHFCPH